MKSKLLIGNERIEPEVSNLQDPPDWWDHSCKISQPCHVSDAGARLLDKLFPFGISLLMTSHPISEGEYIKLSFLELKLVSSNPIIEYILTKKKRKIDCTLLAEALISTCLLLCANFRVLCVSSELLDAGVTVQIS